MERYENEPTVGEDDVLVPARGILDVMDNYAFVRTSGYLPSPEDAYVSLAMVKKFGLRKGDIVTGSSASPRRARARPSSTRWSSSRPSTAATPRRRATGPSSPS